MNNEELWLPILITSNPQEGFELAIKLSRMGVKKTQPNVEVLKELRPKYAENADSLTAASQVIAINFQSTLARVFHRMTRAYRYCRSLTAFHKCLIQNHTSSIYNSPFFAFGRCLA